MTQQRHRFAGDQRRKRCPPHGWKVIDGGFDRVAGENLAIVTDGNLAEPLPIDGAWVLGFAGSIRAAVKW